MPTGSEKQSGPDLGAILEGLIEAGVEFILVGGLAAVVQGAPVTTMDVDIVHKQSSENIGKLLAFLKSIDAFHRRPDDKVIGPDVMAVIEKGKAYENLIEHTVEIEFRGHTVRVLNLKTLVELKRASKDPRDRQRLPVLEEKLRQIEEE